MGECLIIRSGGGNDTSDATATSDVVLSGYTCYVNDELVTGSMAAQNPGNQSLTPGDEYTIEEGYYDGTDEISVTSLSESTSANATAGYILAGHNAWVNGSNVSGSMANRRNVSQTLAANGSYTIPAGWHAGSGKVSQSLATQAAVNVTPGTTNKTACAANRWTTGSIIILGSSNLTSGNIHNGVTIFGVRGTWVGVPGRLYLDIDNTGRSGSLRNSRSSVNILTYGAHNVSSYTSQGYVYVGCEFSMSWSHAAYEGYGWILVQVGLRSPSGSETSTNVIHSENLGFSIEPEKISDSFTGEGTDSLGMIIGGGYASRIMWTWVRIIPRPELTVSYTVHYIRVFLSTTNS